MKPIAFAIVAAGLLNLGLALNPIAAKASDELVTETVQRQKIDDIRLFDGLVEAINASTLSAQTSGQITAVNFDVDDFVKAGEIIVQFSDAEHKAGLDQAQSSLNGAIATRQAAKEDFERIEKLFKNGTVAKARFDGAKSAYEVAKSQVKSSEAAVERAKEQLGYTVVRAPFSGYVVERHVQTGETANPGQPLMTGFSLDELRVKVDVPQQFAPFIRKENKALVYDGNGKTIEAESLTVFPFADAQSNTVTIRAILPENNRQVFPGMLVKIAFKTGDVEALAVDEGAIYRKGEVTGVFLIKGESKIVLQQVRTGRKLGEKIEVISGLEPGDKIAANPFEALLKLKVGE